VRPAGAPDEALLQRLAANCGDAYVHGARSVGKPWRREEDLALADLGLPLALSPNNATLLRRPRGVSAAEDIAERVDGFFSASPGGGYEVWSIWPDLDLAPFGFSADAVPGMCRKPGSDSRPAPPELEIAEVDDDAGIREVWTVLDDAFCEHRTPDPFWDARILSEGYRIWAGRVDGRAVTTATAFIGHGFVGVYAVGTLGEARGRGYGEAVTWAATLCRPDLPATLQASGLGRPVYERMGFRTVTDFTVWEKPERGSSARSSDRRA